MGGSLALGAFLAGLVISESDYAHQALAELLPLRDVLISIFFVSIGMLVDVHDLAAHPGLLAGGVTVVVTTHFMEEAEYCDRIAIQDAGRVLALGTPQEVREQAGSGHDAGMDSAFIAIVEQARARGHVPGAEQAA